MKLYSDKLYHIYLNNICAHHSLKEEEFYNILNSLERMNKLLPSSKKNIIEYESIEVNKEILQDASY